MIRANLEIVQERLGSLNAKCSLATQFLSKLEKAEEVIPTLTQDQKDAVMVSIDSFASDIVTAYNNLVTSFQATEEVVEE